MLAFMHLLICLIASSDATGAMEASYEDISEYDSNTINRESMQRMPLIHKSFHQCSMIESCLHVIKVVLSGVFTLHMIEDELPRNKIGIRIWKKTYHGELKFVIL